MLLDSRKLRKVDHLREGSVYTKVIQLCSGCLRSCLQVYPWFTRANVTHSHACTCRTAQLSDLPLRFWSVVRLPGLCGASRDTPGTSCGCFPNWVLVSGEGLMEGPRCTWCKLGFLFPRKRKGSKTHEFHVQSSWRNNWKNSLRPERKLQVLWKCHQWEKFCREHKVISGRILATGLLVWGVIWFPDEQTSKHRRCLTMPTPTWGWLARVKITIWRESCNLTKTQAQADLVSSPPAAKDTQQKQSRM